MNLTKKIYNWIMDVNVDLRVRLLYVLTVAIFIANIVSAINMIAMGQQFLIWSSNLLILFMMLITAPLIFVKKHYDPASVLISISCDFIGIPVMFFTSGGNASGMPLWMVFAVIVTALICRGKPRIVLPFASAVIFTVCMVIGHYMPAYVIPLEGENAVYNDMLFSFVAVSVILVVVILLHLHVYDSQRVALEEQQNEISRIAHFDGLTGVYNRRAYEKDVKALLSSDVMNKCLVAVDVNGLKKVNDEIGHKAGDEIIIATANCLEQAFEGYGKVYRIGGDEFAVILECDSNMREELFRKLDDNVAAWSGDYSKSITIAKGCCVISEHADMDIEGIRKIADTLMYEDKRKYYEKNGVDRRKTQRN